MQVTVLTGGASSEREVALASARQVVPALRAAGHDVVVVELYGIQNAQVLGSIRGQRDLNSAEAGDVHDRYGGGSRKLTLIGRDGKVLLQESNDLNVAKALQLLETAQ